MYLAGFFVAAYREADYNAREREGYYARYGCGGFTRLCSYDRTPKNVLLEQVPEPCRAYVTWRGNV